MTTRLNRQRRIRATRGQALVEFALILPIMMTIVISILNIMPAITTRGLVLDVSETATERVSHFLPPTAGDAAGDRNLLCNQLLDIVRSEISAQLGASAVTTANSGCTGLSGTKLTPVPGSANPVVYVMVLDANGNALPSSRLMPVYDASTQKLAPVRVQVCVSYTWTPTGGLWYFALKGPGGLTKQMWNAFTYRFCGNTVIDPNRSR
jgi:Flp pilus assembly protein TadG